jgi:septum formation protein
MNTRKIRLCSASETRAKLLKGAGVSFIQSPVGYDEEQIAADTPKSFVYQAAAGKFEEAEGIFGCKDHPILVADTVVASRGKILRKAQNIDEARDILLTQSESVTSIITCMIYRSPALKLIDISATDYIFAKFDKDDLERYLDSGEWQGKAGACMVEGFCRRYIKEVRGYESTAMGLSVEVLKPFL